MPFFDAKTPVIVWNGQVIGTWKKTVKSKQLDIITDLFTPFTDNQKAGFDEAVAQLSRFYDINR